MTWKGSFSHFIIITLLLGMLSVYVSKVPQQQMEQGRWVAHTHDVLSKLTTLSGKLAEAHAAHSTYLQSHTKADQRLYQNIADSISPLLTEITTLTKDNPGQQERLGQLRKFFNGHLDTLIQQPEEKAVAEQVIDNMRHDEMRLLTAREARWKNAMVHSRLFFLAGVLLLYIFITLAYFLAQRQGRIREQLLKLESAATHTQRRMAERMMQIIDVQQDIVSQRLSLQHAMEVITRRTQEITGADGAVIEMLAEEDMLYRAASGLLQAYVGFRIRTKGSLSGLCVTTATALRCDDSETDDRVDREACRKVGVRSMIVVPLMQNDQAIGVLKVASARAHAFTSEELSTLQLMAGLLSATLRDAVASEALQARADTDGMTGLKNHRYFQECLEQEFHRAQRYDNPLTLIMLDVDHFKQLNDRYGHPAGDAILRQLAQLLQNNVRPSDCIARYGGEEFAVILVQTPQEGALATAERICKAVHSTAWPHGKVTVSIGISELREDTRDAHALIAEADKALYQSKTDGRDRITSYAA